MRTFNENIERIEKAKSDIKTAIEDKGVFVGDGLIDTYADKIKQIKANTKSQNKYEKIEKNNTTLTVVPDDGYVLERVEVKASIPMQNKSDYISKNGTYSYVPDGDYDGLKRVDIEVGLDLQNKYVSFDNNGVYTITADDDTYAGLREVEVTVDIPLEDGNAHTFNYNGVYDIYPEDGYKAMEHTKIIVDVQGDSKPILPNGICFSRTPSVFDMGEYDWSNWYYAHSFLNNNGAVKEIKNFPANADLWGAVSYMFARCDALRELPYFDMSHIANAQFFACDCRKIKTAPAYNTRYLRDATYMFGGCSDLETLPAYDFTSVFTADYLVYQCDKLANVGGFIGIRCNFDVKSPVLTEESVINIVNGLYDFAGNYIAPKNGEGVLKLDSSVISNMSDELIGRAIAKSWTIMS